MATVLLIEPDSLANAILGDVISAAGHLVRAVRTGRDALDEAGRRPPHIAVVEARLPDMDVVHCCAAIRTHPAARGQVRILLLADPWTHRALALDGGAVDELLIRPFSFLDLLGRIERLIPKES